MRPFCGFLALLVATVPALAEAPTLESARLRWLHGNYAEARTQYEELVKEPKLKAATALGVSQTWQSDGEYDKALQVIDAALKDHAKNANLHARRAELLHLRGRWKDAEEAADTTLLLKKDHFLARWVRAAVWRERGDVDKADAEFRWFVRAYSDNSGTANELKDPNDLLLVGLAGAERARWHNDGAQFKVIIDDVFGDALQNDKEYWPAEYQIAMILLENHNRSQAVDALDKALKINPRAAEALVGKGLAAIQTYEIRDAELFAERALKINGNLPEALRLRADIHLMGGDLTKALAELERARKVNPRDESTLGRIAACFLLQKKQDDFAGLVKEVTEHDPKPGLFYYELAERLEERRQYDAAEQFYRKAIETRSQLPWPRTGLGLLQMRLGREKEARTILEKAADADPFNVRVTNALKVLRHLDKYETLKTEHFELRFDPKTDRVLARYIAAQLEELYAELAEKFQYQPKARFLVEVFSTHEMFSGRVISLPDLHTIGACTGRMMAMVSPRGKGVAKPFNWNRVLRHEVVHLFNLDQTNFQVPHWLTEGLAVISEGYPRPQAWNQLLLERVPSGDLMNLDSIDLGFIRPRSPSDWHMAYCQSQLYVEYMKSKYGPQTAGELLQAYRDGLDTAAGITKVCKVDKATFEKGYKSHLEAVVKGLKGKPAEKALTFAQLQDANEQDPPNADIAARLAEQFLLRNRKTDARKLVDGVLAKKKGHPLASFVKARLLLAGGDDEEAQKVLEAVVTAKAPEPKVLQLLGKLYYDGKELAKAADTYEQGRKAEPYDSKWLEALARVYTQSGEKEKLIGVLKELVPMDADELELRKRLAKLLLESNQPADAERYARQALEIDVLDPAAQETFLKALGAQKKDAAAEKFRKLLEK